MRTATVVLALLAAGVGLLSAPRQLPAPQFTPVADGVYRHVAGMSICAAPPSRRRRRRRRRTACRRTPQLLPLAG